MLTGWQKTVSKCFLIPQRYVLGIMGFLAVVNCYTMRVCLSLAITEMVAPPNSTAIHYDPDACSAEEGINGSTSSVIKDTSTLYHWSESTQGLILSSFYWGYIFTHLPGGLMAEKFGGKYSLGLGILSTAIFTLITPWVIIFSNGNPTVVIILRILEGVGEGTTYPALTALLAKWVPLKERATIGSFAYAGSQFGTILSNSISGKLISSTGDWASVFYFFGGVGVVWFIIFVMICYSTPEEHPFISDKEKAYLQKELSGLSEKRLKTPWKAILTSVPVWALIITQIGHDWGFFTMVTDLPKYFKDVLKFNVAENGLWSSLPYVIMWFSSLAAGFICDFCVRKNIMTITFSRKFFTTIASMGPAIFIIGASYSGCDRMLAVIMFTIGMGFMGFYYCGMKVNAIDLAPNFAGTLMAIINGIGAMSGIVTPYLVGAIAVDHTLIQWRTVFWVVLAVLAVTNLVYLCFGSAERQIWNDAPTVEAENGRMTMNSGRNGKEVSESNKN